MQLENAIMYLQNVLVTIQNEISNEQRYTLLYKFVAKAHIHHMQMWYNDAVAKGSESSDQLIGGESSNTSATEESKGASKANQTQSSSSSSGKVFGEDGYKYPQLEFPATHEELAAYNRSVKTNIEKKYETLTKNVHFYLTYLFLEIGDFRNAVKHGQLVLKTY